MEKYKKLIFANLILRLPLLFLIPIYTFGDGVKRYIPNIFQVLKLDFNFYTPPLFMILNAGWGLLFSGPLVEFFWRLTPFIFFILILFLLPKLYEILKVNSNEKIIITLLFLFSTLNILYSNSIMLEMLVLFFTLMIFILIETYQTLGNKSYFFILIMSTLMLYTKQTGYFILAGFFLYIYFKKIPIKDKVLLWISLSLGAVLALPWMLKNYFLIGNLLAPEDGGLNLLIPMFIENVGKVNYLEILINLYHYFWEIPTFAKVLPTFAKLSFSGGIFLLYLGYYIIFLLSSLVVSFSIILGIYYFGKKYREFLFLMLPIFILAFIWSFIFFIPNDSGRFTFSFHIFLYFFSAKFVTSIKNKWTRRFFYISIIIFAILSIINTYGVVFYLLNK